MEVKGKIEKVMGVQQVTDTFKKREFVLLVQDGNYPQHIKFEIHSANVDKLTPVEGDEVNVKFNLKGRPYEKNGTTMYFNTLVAWFIEKAGSERPQVPSAPTGANVTQVSSANVAPPVVESNVDSNELPF